MAEPFNDTDPVRKSYFIKESERNTGDPSQDEGKVAQLENDGKLHSTFLGEDMIDHGVLSAVDEISFSSQNKALAYIGEDTELTVSGLTNGQQANLVLMAEEIPWDLSDPTYSNRNISTGSNAVNGLFFKPDGTKMYVIYQGLRMNPAIRQYSLSIPWDITTATSEKTLGYHVDYEYDIFFKPDGTKMFYSALNGVTEQTREYSLSTPWDITTAGSAVAITSQGNRIAHFSDDGLILYEGKGDTLYQRTVATAYDLASSLGAPESLDISAQTSNLRNIFFSDDGTKLFVLGGAIVYQYTLSTPWDIATATYDSKSHDASAQLTTGSSLFFKGDGLNMFIGDSDGDVYEYYLRQDIPIVIWQGVDYWIDGEGPEITEQPVWSFIVHFIKANGKVIGQHKKTSQ